jgi:NADPH2:quinone reductase
VKAWQMSRYGEPEDVLELAEVPRPEPGLGHILVRVLAATVNFPDVLLCRGTYQVRPPLPFTPGLELCGEVIEDSRDVPGFTAGDRVIGAAVFPSGGFAEYALMDAARALPAPEGLDDAEAAPLLVTYQTGWFGLHRKARLKPGETLLVHAAAGGVGSAAVQLGKAAGARVIGVVGGPEKAKLARELGADVVVDRYAEDFVAVVKEVTHGRGANVVYDSVGGESFFKSTKCIAFEGRIVVVGFASGEIPQAALNHALVKNYDILGLHWALYEKFDPALVRVCQAELTKLIAAGQVKPLITERLPLTEVPDALRRLGAGSTTGRVVFQPLRLAVLRLGALRAAALRLAADGAGLGDQRSAWHAEVGVPVVDRDDHARFHQVQAVKVAGELLQAPRAVGHGTGGFVYPQGLFQFRAGVDAVVDGQVAAARQPREQAPDNAQRLVMVGHVPEHAHEGQGDRLGQVQPTAGLGENRRGVAHVDVHVMRFALGRARQQRPRVREH